MPLLLKKFQLKTWPTYILTLSQKLSVIVQKVEVFKKTFKKGDTTDKSTFSLLVPLLISHKYLKN